MNFKIEELTNKLPKKNTQKMSILSCNIFYINHESIDSWIKKLKWVVYFLFIVYIN